MRYLLIALLIVVLGSFGAMAQDTGGENYFVEAVVDNSTPYVGQQITYIFRLYDAAGLDNPLYEPSDFEGFWRIDLGGVSQHVEQLNGRQYTVSEIKTALYPSRTGAISIAPAGVLLPDTVFQSKRELKANPVVVQVQPLPEGAPADFSGGVGQFQMSVTLDRQSVHLGEPVTLRLTVTGSGNVEQMPLPTVPFPSTWRVYENPASYSATQQNDQVIGSKVYELVILPDQAGVQALPVVTLNYFDPAALVYRSVSSAPVEIEVLSTDSVAFPTPEADNSVSSVMILKPIAATLPDSDNAGLFFWFLWLIPPLVVAASWGWRSYQQQLRRNRLVNRQSQALQSAYKRLDASKKMASKAACEQVKIVVTGYIEDKMGLSAGQAANWQQAMKTRGIPVQIGQELQSCIDFADQGLYAPDSNWEIKTLIDRVSKILSDVDRLWKAP